LFWSFIFLNTKIQKNTIFGKNIILLKRLLSYFLPINIYKIKSEVSQRLYVTLCNGKLLLDSQNANYSYGSLQRILRFGLKKIGFKKIKNLQSVLILGVAAGSVIKTLRYEIGYQNKIKGVEIDPKVIEIANKYFDLDKIPNVQIEIADVQQFVKTEKAKHGLVIIDVFRDLLMPSFLFTEQFAIDLELLLCSDGMILFNTMNINKKKRYKMDFFLEKFNLIKAYRLEEYNTIYIFNKKNNKKLPLQDDFSTKTIS